MTSPGEPPPLAAPGLIGPISILNQPISGPRSARRRKNRPFAHVHLNVDLQSEPGELPPVPALQQLENLLSGRRIVEAAGLVRMAGGTLHAFSARGFRRVAHWEVAPGGWLPLPEPTRRPSKEETVGHLAKILESDQARSIEKARTFSVRLSDFNGNHADVVVRRVHGKRRPAISLDLQGYWTREDLEKLKGALADRLPVAHSEVTKFQYTVEK
jgi:hypothetical protein